MAQMWLRRVLIVAACVILGGLAALIVPVSAGGSGVQVLDTQAHLPDPIAALQKAQQAAPYRLHLPTTLPEGASPLVVDWVDEGGAVAVDIWWTLPGASRFHIWQTNDPSFEDEGKDPLSSGVPVLAGTTEWRETSVDWVAVVLTELCRRFDDGVAVCVSSDQDPAWVRALAATVD
jgi:hypothetical protein